jgi:hypothetical protein
MSSRTALYCAAWCISTRQRELAEYGSCVSNCAGSGECLKTFLPLGYHRVFQLGVLSNDVLLALLLICWRSLS